MKLFLTSNIGATIHRNGLRIPGQIDNHWGFLTRFKETVKSTKQMIYISSSPENNERVSDWFDNTIAALDKAKIHFERNILVNAQNAILLGELIGQSDVVFLSGGHLPTQNQFFQDIKLKTQLSNFNGVIVAQSAGSMNCAGTVYVCPELPGESVDSNFQRFRPGLGITDINIIPHYNDNRELILDGKKFYEEIVAPDTFQIPLYVLSDGAYFYIHGKETEAFGEIYLFKEGKWEQISGFSS